MGQVKRSDVAYEKATQTSGMVTRLVGFAGHRDKEE